MAADLRHELNVVVETVEGHYGEFSVLVDGHEVFNAGALAFLGVLPTRRRVRELVVQALGATGAARSESPPHDV